MKSKYIVAIEIGSSRIKGIVASVDETASICVLAVEEVDSGECVRYGRVQNAREVAERVNEIIRRLENNPSVAPGRVSTVFIANGGRSLASSFAEATLQQPGEAEITLQTLERLHKEARYNLATDREVLAIAPRHYFVDNTEVKKVVGAFGTVLKGEFTIMTCSPENRRALDRVTVESQQKPVPRDYVTRLLAQTEMALTDSERQLGVVFVDFGAETTTTAVFRDGALQLACTLPMGSANITRDLCVGLSTTAPTAENIKITKGRAVAERVNINAPDAETREVINYVSARAGEIIANINNLLADAGFKASELPAGLVIAGGGARLQGFNEMLEAQTKLKVRPAAVDASIAMACPGKSADHFDVISLVKYAAAHSDLNCVSMPEGAAAPAVTATAAAPAAPRPDTAQGAYGRRVPMAEDDPGLLDDDLDQPANVNEADAADELPPQGSDAAATRKSLLARLKKFSLNDWLRPPREEEEGMDE